MRTLFTKATVRLAGFLAAAVVAAEDGLRPAGQVRPRDLARHQLRLAPGAAAAAAAHGQGHAAGRPRHPGGRGRRGRSGGVRGQLHPDRVLSQLLGRLQERRALLLLLRRETGTAFDAFRVV